MRINKIALAIFLSLTILAGCANRDAALLGSLVGRSLGKPIGAVATAVDETFKTAGEVVKENPRYQRQQTRQRPNDLMPAKSAEEDYYYRTEVIVKTRGPARIEALSLQETEDVSEFWR